MLFFCLPYFNTLSLAFCGLDFVTALSGATTALANVGPGMVIMVRQEVSKV